MTGKLDAFHQYLDWEVTERAAQRIAGDALEVELVTAERRLAQMNKIRHPIEWYVLTLEIEQMRTVLADRQRTSQALGVE